MSRWCRTGTKLTPRRRRSCAPCTPKRISASPTRRCASMSHSPPYSALSRAFVDVTGESISELLFYSTETATTASDPNYLRDELKSRLHRGHVTYDLLFQLFVEEQKTPLEDSSIEWMEADAPAVS